MFEMLWLAYILEWIQILLHSDFDEVDKLRMKEWMIIMIGSFVCGIVGHLLGWFDGNIVVAIGYGVYMIAAYLCTFLIYKIKRSIDAKILNNDLKHFHERRLQEQGQL